MKSKGELQIDSLNQQQEILTEIGQYLRDARQARGEDLYDIAEFLRIRPTYLFAIEEGDLSEMPGPTYSLGFLRSYATYLGADAHAAVNEARFALGAKTIEPTAKAQPIRPEPEDRLPAFKIVAMSAAAAVALIFAWQLRATDDTSFTENMASLPGSIGRTVAELIDPNLTPDAKEVDEVASYDLGRPRQVPSAALLPDDMLRAPGLPDEEPPEGISIDEPIPALSLSEEEAPPSHDASSAIAAETPFSPAQNTGNQPATATDLLRALQARDDDNRRPKAQSINGIGDSRVVLVALDETWIQIRSSSRDYVRARTLMPGERFALPNREDLALSTGNAGGLQIVVDGEALGSPGSQKEVIKALSLAPLTLIEMFEG